MTIHWRCVAKPMHWHSSMTHSKADSETESATIFDAQCEYDEPWQRWNVCAAGWTKPASDACKYATADEHRRATRQSANGSVSEHASTSCAAEQPAITIFRPRASPHQHSYAIAQQIPGAKRGRRARSGFRSAPQAEYSTARLIHSPYGCRYPRP